MFPMKIANKEAKNKYDNLSEGEKLKIQRSAFEMKQQSEIYASKMVHDLYFLTTQLPNYQKYLSSQTAVSQTDTCPTVDANLPNNTTVSSNQTDIIEGCSSGVDENFRKELYSILKYDKTGILTGEFKNFKDKPVFQLKIVPKDYELEIYSPPEFVETIYNTCAYLMQCAQAYHITMMQTNSQLSEYLRKMRPDVDFTLLRVEEDDKNQKEKKANKSTLFFDKNLEWRIGIVCTWIDELGMIFGKIKPFPKPPLVTV